MRRLQRFRPLLLVGLGLLTIALINFGINLRCRSVFNSVTDEVAISDAFYSGDTESIDSIANTHGLEYQKIVEGKIVESSDSWLPKPDIISFQQTISDAVILSNTPERIENRLPYRVYRGVSIYVMVPICTEDCSTEMYLVYKKALL